jgi:hypothetical protein
LLILRLANVKGTYDHALRLLENPTSLDGAVSLVLLDNAIEAAFKIALDKSGLRVKEDPKFPELLDCVLNIENLADLKKQKLSLLTLHRARNGFQHQGMIPDLNTVQSEYKPLAEQTLNEVSSREFGLEWKDVSLSLLIGDETVRMLYKKAEESFKKADFNAAVAYLIYAFEVTKQIAKLKIFGTGLSSLRLKIKSASGKDKVIVDYLTALDEEIEVFKLGLNYMDLRNYLDMAQIVGIGSVLHEMPINLTEEIVITNFKKKLQEMFVDDNPLKEWYLKMSDAILKFIIRSEANSRFSMDQFSKLAEAIISGLSEAFKGLSKSHAVGRTR